MSDLAETLAVIDAAHLRLMLDPTNDADCELAAELLYARVNVKIASERLDDMVTRDESREAVGVAAVLSAVIAGSLGLVAGLLLCKVAPAYWAGLFL